MGLRYLSNRQRAGGERGIEREEERRGEEERGEERKGTCSLTHIEM